MNKYGSVERFLRARNIAEIEINPPADLSVVAATFKKQVFQAYGYMSGQTNFTIKKVGIFSNFADGLVFKLPYSRMTLEVNAASYNLTSLTGTLNFTAGSKSVSGGGTTLFTSELTAGDIIDISINDRLFVVDSITDDDNLVLTDYATNSGAFASDKHVLQAQTGIITYDISELNVLYDVDFFGSAAVLSPDSGSVIELTYSPQLTDTVFLTKTIDTSYDEDMVHFDAAIIVEFT